MKRIGIFGGAFDPPHLGHLVLADRALAELALDEVCFVPCAAQPLKGHLVAEGELRLALTRLLVTGRPEFTVCDLELTRGGVSYTVDTVRQLHAARPQTEWWLLLGADALADFPRWRAPREILQHTRLGVAERPGSPLAELLPTLPAWLTEQVDPFAMPALAIASRDLRRDLAAGRSARYLLPAPVLEEIRKLRLYSSA